MKSPSSNVWKWESSSLLVAIVIAIAAVALLLVRDKIEPNPPPELPALGADNSEYLKMAQGDTRNVMSPFSRRALYPAMARCLSHATGLSIRVAFILLDISSVLLLAYFLGRIFLFFQLSPWWLPFFILTPFTLNLMENGYMPDLFHAALTTLFFLLILREKFLAGLFVLAVAYMARENTLILCLMLGALAWLRGRAWITIASGLVILYGTAFGSWCVRQGQPNIHHLPDFLYLGLKMPHQFLKNVLGFRIWTNTLPFGEPFAKWTLPGYLQSGDVRVLGFCYPEWQLSLFTLITLLTLFGTGPLIIWMTRNRRLWKYPHPFAIQLAFIYGLFAFLLGTSIGDWIDRLIGYGWPLFWIVVPYIFSRVKKEHQALLYPILFSLWIVAWVPALLNYSRTSSLVIGMLTLLITIIAYALVWKNIRNRDVFSRASKPA